MSLPFRLGGETAAFRPLPVSLTLIFLGSDFFAPDLLFTPHRSGVNSVIRPHGFLRPVSWQARNTNALRLATVQISVLPMGRPGARFRLSLKDHQTGESLKVELIPAPYETPFASNPAAKRYRIRVNGKASLKVNEATLTEVFNRLRRWLVNRSKKNES